MSIKNTPILTAAGIALMARINAGDGAIPLKITRIVTKSAADSDHMNPTPADEQQTYKIVSRDKSADHAWIVGELTNAADHAAEPTIPAWQTPYSIAQINFYAYDPALGAEVIFRVLIPAPTPPMPAHCEREHVMEHTFDFAVGNASEVIINIDPTALRKHIAEKIATADGVHGIRKYGKKLQFKDDDGVWQDVNTGGDSPPFTTPQAALTATPEQISVEAITTLGGENAYTLALEPALTRYSHGMLLFIRFHIVNSSVTPTINVNGRGAIPIRGASGGVLTAGDIGANSTFLCEVFETPQGLFELRMIRHEVNPMTFSGALSNAYDVSTQAPLTAYRAGLRYVVRFGEANTVGGERVINNLAPALTMNIDGVGRLPILNAAMHSPAVGRLPENSVFLVEIHPNSHILLIERLDDDFRLAGKSDLESAVSVINSRIDGQVVTGVLSANGTVTLGFRPSCVILMARTVTGETNNSLSTTGTNWVPWGRLIAMSVSGAAGDSLHPQTPNFSQFSPLTLTATGFTTANMLGGISRSPSQSSLGVDAMSANSTNTLRYIAFR
jgi:hypothetical protein